MTEFKLEELLNSQFKDDKPLFEEQGRGEFKEFEQNLSAINETGDLIEKMMRHDRSIVPSNTPVQSPKFERRTSSREQIELPDPTVLDFEKLSQHRDNISLSEILLKADPTRSVEELKFDELFHSYSATGKQSANNQDVNSNYTYLDVSTAAASGSQNVQSTPYLTSLEDISVFGILDNTLGTRQFQTPTKANRNFHGELISLENGFNSPKKIKEQGKDQVSNDITLTLLLPQFSSSPISKITSQFPEPRPLEEMFEMDHLYKEFTPEPNISSNSNVANTAQSLEQSLASNKRKLKALQRRDKKAKALQSNSAENIFELSKHEANLAANPKDLSSSASLNLDFALPVTPRQSSLRFHKPPSEVETEENIQSCENNEDGLRTQRRAFRHISKKYFERTSESVEYYSQVSEWIDSSPLKKPTQPKKKPSVRLPSLTAEGMVKRTSNAPKLVPRSKSGCWTCRIRKKKCTENKPSCAQCDRLGLQCDGYAIDKPDFFEDPVLKRKKLDLIKKHTMKVKKEQLQQRMEAGKSAKRKTAANTKCNIQPKMKTLAPKATL